MKRFLSFFVLFLGVISMSAQQKLGDLNGDGKVDASDVVKLVNIIAEESIPSDPDPQPTENTLIAEIVDVADTYVEIELKTKPADLDILKYTIDYAENGNTNLQTVSSTFSSRLKISGLKPKTTYVFIAYANIRGGDQLETSAKTFTTTESILSLYLSFGNITTTNNSATVKVFIDGDALEGTNFGLRCAKNKSNLSLDENNVPMKGTFSGRGNYEFEISDLEEGTTYYLRAFAYTVDGRTETKDSEFTTKRIIVYKEPETIDLGLSVKWSSFNLGAQSPEDYGGYFGWGDNTGELTTNVEGLYAPDVANRHIGGDGNYDLARAKLGGYWRLPTPEEVAELKQCNPTVTTVNGVIGVQFTRNGNSLFIPYAGYRMVSETYMNGQNAYLWTDYIDAAQKAYNVQLMPSRVNNPNGDFIAIAAGKSNLATIRAVWDEPKPDNTTKAVEGSESNPVTGAIPMEAVDLGLPSGTKWARWNIGAKPEGGYGRYYSWGATAEQTSYTLADYESNPYYDVAFDDIPNGGDLSDEDDVAHKLWGGDWCMPKEGEFKELFLYCEKEWTTEGGVYGYRFTSKENGKSIFIPAAGHKKTGVQNIGVEGLYWTVNGWYSTDKNKKKDMATAFCFYHGMFDPMITDNPRYEGLQVRPVIRKK